MDKRNKDRLRRALRALMIFAAVVLLVVSLVIPVINNFVAAGVADDLEALPLPPHTTVEGRVSASGRLLDGFSGVQYFGAVLLHSDLPLTELSHHYIPYRQGLFDCLVEEQVDASVAVVENRDLAFPVAVTGDGWYILYTWGSVPDWAADWLNLDIRGH